MLVSVITTTRNRRKLLERLIKSLLQQTHQSIEHIIVDAASTDGTKDLLRSYENQYNLHWISEKDRMQTEGINKGLRLAHGELITITHDDDYWLPNGIAVLVEEFRKNKQLELLYGDTYSLFPDGHREPACYRYYTLSEMINGGYQIPQHGCLFKRSSLQRVGWLDERIEHVAEYDLFLRIIKTGGFYNHIEQFVGVGLQHERKASWVCWNHSWDETKIVNWQHGGRVFSKFTIIYIKNRYFRNFGEFVRYYFPGLYRWLKKMLKVPEYV